MMEKERKNKNTNEKNVRRWAMEKLHNPNPSNITTQNPTTPILNPQNPAIPTFFKVQNSKKNKIKKTRETPNPPGNDPRGGGGRGGKEV